MVKSDIIEDIITSREILVNSKMSLFVIFALLTITNAELIFVNVIHRHGDRTPQYMYPTDPYPESFWTEGLGMLTNLGKNQLFDLGKFMRHRYLGFLPINYHDSDLHVESSEMSRILMSAYCSLAGLYEPHGEDIWSPFVLNWQPIPVYSLPKSLDNKILGMRSCPQYDQLREKAYRTEITAERRKEYEDVLKNVSYYAGFDFDSKNLSMLSRIANIYDTLFIEDLNYLQLPDWALNFYPEPLREIFNFLSFELPNYNNELKQLHCGPLLREIIQHFDDKINGSIKQKWWHYSGHDITIANLLNCLNVYDGDRPVYGSAVFLELHSRPGNKYEVSVVYKKSEDVLHNLTIKDCDLNCPLEKFKELVKDILPKNWEEECIV